MVFATGLELLKRESVQKREDPRFAEPTLGTAGAKSAGKDLNLFLICSPSVKTEDLFLFDTSVRGVRNLQLVPISGRRDKLMSLWYCHS